MPEPHRSRGSFLDELKRRKVVRVGIVYAAVAWAVTQVADVALSAFQAPPWVMQVVIVLLLLGFPVAVALAWAFDVTPEGVRRTARPAEATVGVPESEGGEPVAEIASLASGVEDLLPTAEGSPFSLSYALAFRTWALHDVLGHPDARDAAIAYERAADGMLETANTPQLAVGVLGQRAMNYLRLGEPEQAVALADSLTRAFPPGLDEWWSSPHARRVRAAVYAHVGREGEAIDILKPLVPPPSHYTLALLRVDPTWEPLRSHPRWAEILEAAR